MYHPPTQLVRDCESRIACHFIFKKYLGFSSRSCQKSFLWTVCLSLLEAHLKRNSGDAQWQWPLFERNAAPLDSEMASQSHKNGSSVIECPCNEFGTVQAIRSVLNSDERTQALVTWLSTDAADATQRLSCQTGPNLRCARRVSASFSILNGIRDACRPFLESGAARGLQVAVNRRTRRHFHLFQHNRPQRRPCWWHERRMFPRRI